MINFGGKFSFMSLLSENKHKLQPFKATQYFFQVLFEAKSSFPRVLISQFFILSHPALRVANNVISAFDMES